MKVRKSFHEQSDSMSDGTKWVNRPLLGLPSIKPALSHEPGLAAAPPIPSNSPGAGKLVSVAVADITRSGLYRALDDKHVADLQESIRRIGLITPISVAASTPNYVLIAGQHRMEAVQRLGWTHIEAIILDANGTSNRLVAIAENLHRLELCPLDRAELQNEWLQASQDQAGQIAQPSGGHQPNDKGISKTARTLEVSRRELKRAQIIAGISPEAKRKARELGLHNKQSALLKIAAGQTVYEQLKIAVDIPRKGRKSRSSASEPAGPESLVTERAVVASTVSEPSLPTVNCVAPCDVPANGDIGISESLNRRDHPTKAFEALLFEWEAAPRLNVAWADAPLATRSRFATEVLRLVLSGQSKAKHAE